jgi:hypothetical protein
VGEIISESWARSNRYTWARSSESAHPCRRKNCRVPSPRHDERGLSRIERHWHVGGTQFKEARANRTWDSHSQLSTYEPYKA